MEIWIILGAPLVGLVFLLDYLIRRKKWSDSTKGERASLLLNAISVIPYMIASAFGLLMGVVGCGSETALGRVIYDVTLYMGALYVLVALGAVVASLLLRKFGKIKTSIFINVAAIAYIIIVAVVNYLAGELL
jgi:hypothetical protein